MLKVFFLGQTTELIIPHTRSTPEHDPLKRQSDPICETSFGKAPGISFVPLAQTTVHSFQASIEQYWHLAPTTWNRMNFHASDANTTMN